MSDNRKRSLIVMAALILFPAYFLTCGWWGGFVAQNNWGWGMVVIVPLAPYWIAGMIYSIWLFRRG